MFCFSLKYLSSNGEIHLQTVKSERELHFRIHYCKTVLLPAWAEEQN